jgi:hypothetical protein
MKNVIIASIIAAALPLATMPASAGEMALSGGVPSQVVQKKRLIITKGTRLNESEMGQYAMIAKISHSQISKDAGGQGDNTGTTILAVIGALAILGVLYAASQKNKSEQ